MQVLKGHARTKGTTSAVMNSFHVYNLDNAQRYLDAVRTLRRHGRGRSIHATTYLESAMRCAETAIRRYYGDSRIVVTAEQMETILRGEV